MAHNSAKPLLEPWSIRIRSTMDRPHTGSVSSLDAEPIRDGPNPVLNTVVGKSRPGSVPPHYRCMCFMLFAGGVVHRREIDPPLQAADWQLRVQED